MSPVEAGWERKSPVVQMWGSDQVRDRTASATACKDGMQGSARWKQCAPTYLSAAVKFTLSLHLFGSGPESPDWTGPAFVTPPSSICLRLSPT